MLDRLLRRITTVGWYFYAILFLVFAPALTAAPRLFLGQTALVISVAPGANGPTQEIDSLNIGDGTLKLQLSSSVSWLIPSLGPQHPCSLRINCVPVEIALETSSLANGTYTGTIVVSDPNAVDAPQFITVTVHVGGNVPGKFDLYAPPGGSASGQFFTVTAAAISVSKNAPWLSIAVSGDGSFVFNVPYQVSATAAAGMSVGDYNGTFTLTGSSFTPDDKTVPVLLHVTTQAILQAAPTAVQFRIAQGANKQTAYVTTTNGGQGKLSILNVSANSSSGNWLGAQTVPGYPTLVSITADQSGLSPGLYEGTCTIVSNAANSNVVIPVQLTVVTPTAPVAFGGGILNNGDFDTVEKLPQGGIVALFGDQLTYGDPQESPMLPLSTSLGNTQVLLNGQAVPLYFVSPAQINFQIPIDAKLGDALIQVVRNGQKGNLAFLTITDRAARFILRDGGPYVAITTPDGTLTGIPGHPMGAGDKVTIYAIGLGQTTPVVPSGAASPSNPAAVVPPTQVCFGEHTPFAVPSWICTHASFAGLTPGFAGLYQINLTVPAGVPPGGNSIFFVVGNSSSSAGQVSVR